MLTLALAACQPEVHDWREDYDWVWEGEHVAVYGYGLATEDACGGSLDTLDLHIGSVADFFGYDETLQHEYLWISDEIWDDRCHPAGACTASGVPWTRNLPDMHEATHAVSYVSRGRSCPSLLEEGVAVYFGAPGFHSISDPTSGEYVIGVEDLLTAAPLAYGDYERAGNFASFLVEEYGPEAIASLCEKIPFYNTLDDWQTAVPEVMDIELPELLAAYEQYPRCFGQQYRARWWECAGEPHVTVDPNVEVVFEIEMDCADEGMIGPVNGRMIATRRIAAPQDMWVNMHLLDETGQDVDLDYNLQQCAACSENPDVYASSDFPPNFDLRAGVYELVVFADLDFSQTIAVHLQP